MKQVIDGQGFGVAAKELGMTEQTLHNWVLITKRLNVFAAETQRIEAIYQQKLTALDDLKKSLLRQAFSGVL